MWIAYKCALDQAMINKEVAFIYLEIKYTHLYKSFAYN